MIFRAAQGCCFPAGMEKGAGAVAAPLLDDWRSPKGKRQKFPHLRKRRNKSGSHQTQRVRMGLCRSCTERTQSSVGSRDTAETPNWGCGAQAAPAAPQGCLADDPTAIPQHPWDSLSNTSRARVSCQSPKTSPQETHTLHLCSWRSAKQTRGCAYHFNLNK